MTDAFQAENSQMNAGIADNYGKDRKCSTDEIDQE